MEIINLVRALPNRFAVETSAMARSIPVFGDFADAYDLVVSNGLSDRFQYRYLITITTNLITMSPLVRSLACMAICLIAIATQHYTASAQPGKPGEAREGYVKSSDGVQLFYHITGKGKDTIVMLHGGPGLNMGYFAPDMEPLGASFVLLFYDQRGSGKSSLITDSAKINLNAHIEDLEALRRYFNIQRMSIIGHSWGAMLAARYALKYPDRISKMVFSNPGPLRRNPSYTQTISNISKWMDSSTLEQLSKLRAARTDTSRDAQETCREFWKLFIKGYFSAPFDTITIKKMKGDFCSASSPAIRNGLRVSTSTWASLGDWDWRNDFHQLKNMVLIIAGTKDIIPMEAIQEWKNAFPNVKLILIEKAGHYPQVEQPALYFSHVTTFLQ
jgi:proline iminopeptidase